MLFPLLSVVMVFVALNNNNNTRFSRHEQKGDLAVRSSPSIFFGEACIIGSLIGSCIAPQNGLAVFGESYLNVKAKDNLFLMRDQFSATKMTWNATCRKRPHGGLRVPGRHDAK